MIDFKAGTVEIDYFKRIARAARKYPERAKDIFDSISDNQFLAKEKIIEYAETFGILNKDLNVVILGSWYGTILIPSLAPIVKQVTVYDIDKIAITISKNLFDYENVDYNHADIFKEYNKKSFSEENTLIINTSCEHMHPMNQWKGWKSKQNNLYFAMQSNDMFDIEGHVNCVNFIEEFEMQMPEDSIIFDKKEIEDTRGTRFFLFGRMLSNSEFEEKRKQMKKRVEEKQKKLQAELKKWK